MMKGGQASLEIGLLTAIIATVVSTIYGAVAGLVGGVVDGFMMRIVDVGLSIPTFLIILIVSARYGATVVSLVDHDRAERVVRARPGWSAARC